MLRQMAGIRNFLLRLVAVFLFAFGASSAAHAEIALATCIAPLPAGAAAPAASRYDCGPAQNRFGAGNFAAQLRFAPVQSTAGDPLVLRSSI